MCKFNLTDAISTSIDPLAGWVDQKMPPQAWDFPMVAPPLLDDMLPSFEPLPQMAPPMQYMPPQMAPPQHQPLLTPSEEGLIPDDLQDLFLGEGADAVPSLPTCEANCLLDELLSAPPASPPLFGTLSPPPPPLSPPEGSLCTSTSASSANTSHCASPCAAEPAGPICAELLPPPALSPDPILPLSLDAWVPTLSPPLSEPFSPPSGCDESRGLGSAAPDWSPSTLAPPAKRRQARPRPYDKQTRRQITEEERRLRKKEQNKSAATRYRQKKKEEQELICTDQEQLESRNAQLKERVNTLTRELNYLKHLMKEVIKFKRSI